MTDDGPPPGWCPECDGPSQCAPGTCCGVGAPEAARELHRHLDELQIHARRLGFCCYAAALDPNGPCPWHAEAAAPPPAPELCGCADAERTYEQLLDYTAELGAELDRQRVIVRAAEALVTRLDDIPESGKEGLYEADTADEDEPHVGALLDALAAAVRASRPEGETE